MDTMKPPSTNRSNSLVRKISKMLRLKSIGLGQRDRMKKIKSTDTCSVSTSIQSQQAYEDEKLQRKQSMEVLLAKLFVSISAIKAAYAQIQIAETPYDPESVQAADQLVISELKKISELKLRFAKKEFFPSQHSYLSSEIQEQYNLVKTYEILTKKLESQILLKDSVLFSKREELNRANQTNQSLETKLQPIGSFDIPDDLNLFDLSPSHFISLHHYTMKSIRSFLKLVMDGMKSSNWDLRSAVNAIEPAAVYWKPSHTRYTFESYIARLIFSDFQSPNFSLPLELIPKDQTRRTRYFYSRFTELKLVNPNEFLTQNPQSGFAKFCVSKYLSLVHPQMESSFFGDTTQRNQLSSGEFPVTTFFSTFSELAKRVWLLHCLAFCLEPPTRIFQAAKGCRFSQVYMQSVVQAGPGDSNSGAGTLPEKFTRVGFTVVPGFNLGRTVIPCKVYVCPSQ